MTESQGAEPAGEALAALLEGLGQSPKRISSKYHYDERGSELFEEITRLDEYYPTRTEFSLLRELMPEWVAEGQPRTLVELGAGNAEKTRAILGPMLERVEAPTYVPVDVSADFLEASAETLRSELPDLTVRPVVADMTRSFPLPRDLPEPFWVAFLGSTLGNFEYDEACRMLSRIADRLGETGSFLLGVDLRPGPHKSAERIELAYNDAAGITAAFSLNVLSVLNANFGTDFDPTQFRHVSKYSAERGRIETDLESTADQVVHFPDGTEISLDAGERIRTEISGKYDRPTVEAIFAKAGLEIERWAEDPKGYYALILGRRAS